VAKRKRRREKIADDILLVIGSSPKINTGFSQVARMMVIFGVKSKKFKKVVYLAYNTPTDKDDLPTKVPKSVEIHEEPMSSNAYGNIQIKTILPPLLKEGRVFVITVGDPWNFYYMEQVAGINNLIWMPYVSVESQMLTTIVAATNSKNINISLSTLYHRADLNIAYSKFGMSELNKSGIKCEDYLYHMIDVKQIQSYEETKQSATVRKVVRDIAGDDSTIIGTVCANAYRKGLDLIMSTVAELVHNRNKNIFLVLHVPRGRGQSNVTQLDHLIREFDIPAIITTDLISPPVKEGGRVTIFGYDNETLDGIMRSLDIYINMSRAEGFGIPIIEAAARHTDVVVSDCCTMGEIAEVLGPNIHKIKVDEHQASFTGTNQLLFQPSIKSAADNIEDIIDNKKEAKPEYNMIAFDLNDLSGQYMFNSIIDKAKKIRKNTNEVVINFGGLLSNGDKNTYVINAVEAGVKHYEQIDFILNTYENRPVDAVLDTMSINNVLAKTYTSLLLTHSELFTDRIRNVYNLSNILHEHKYMGTNLHHDLPKGVHPHIKSPKFMKPYKFDESDKPKVAVILISTTGKGGSKLLPFIDDNKDIIKDNVIYSVLDFYAETRSTINISIVHAKSSGMKYVPFDNLAEMDVDYVVIPYNMRMDILGRYVMNIASKMNPKKIIVNSINLGTIKLNDIVEFNDDNMFVQMFDAWGEFKEIATSVYHPSSLPLPRDQEVAEGSS